MSYKEDHTINIDTVENVIKFSRKSERGTCEHKNIQISAEENEVLCTDCKARKGRGGELCRELKVAHSFISQITQQNRPCSKERYEQIKLAMKAIEQRERVA